MTHQTPEFHVPNPIDTGRQIAQLRHALMLVRQIAGRETAGEDNAAPLEPFPARRNRLAGQERLSTPYLEHFPTEKPVPTFSGSALDEGARISGAYGDAAPVVQRRFDALVAETALWAAAGVEALLAADGADARPQAAAARLADELAKALRDMSRLLGL